MSDMIEYIEISISLLLKVKRPLSFDLYVQRTANKYSKISNMGELIDVSRIEAYANKGIEYFYITNDDYKIYTEFICNLGAILQKSSDSFKPREAIEILKELTIFTVKELSEGLDVNEKVFESAGVVVSESIEILEKNPKLAFNLITLMGAHGDLMKNSLATSILSVLLAKKLEILSKANLEIIGLGGFFHDMGMTQLNFDPEETEILSRDQRIEIYRHPELGRDLLTGNSIIKREVLLIILQHHEQPNGLGYPNKLKDRDIYPPAKIISVASSFVELVVSSKLKQGVSKDEAFKNLEDSRDKFDSKMLREFKELIYPECRVIKKSSSTYK
ncbi:MAG: HD domain-containing protein [Bacteriovoracaceae bacterium]|nr:HD domain-containing protein [Bacteriovoracaceae bacterium]